MCIMLTDSFKLRVHMILSSHIVKPQLSTIIGSQFYGGLAGLMD